MRRVPRAERERVVAETADLLSITRLLDRRPAELSGGEQQRVAMGRAIVRRPEVFLFDEPLSNLDAALRAELRVELGKLLRRLGATALYVTHDQSEAMTLGDRIAVLRGGLLEQVDTPRRIYENPATVFVAEFFGSPPMNLLPADRDGSQVRIGPITLPAPETPHTDLVLGLRPEHLRLGAGQPGLTGTVTHVEPHGAETHLEIEADGMVLRTRLVGFETPQRGSVVPISFDPKDVLWFRRGTGRAL
jgi:ABC-type sugar transport system ATPase subunit